MIKPVFDDAVEAVADVQDGASIMIGGFAGIGVPFTLLRALAKRGVKELTIILAKPDTKEKFEKIGLPVVAEGPDAFRRRIEREVPMFKEIIDKAGLKIQ